LRIINIDPNPDPLRSGGRSQNPTRLVGKASFGQHSTSLKHELLGVVLNGLSARRIEYYSNYRYYRNYKKYYGTST